MAKKKTEAVEPVEITPDDSVVPVYLAPPTEAEQAEREQWAVEQVRRETEEAAKEIAKQSAIAKLYKLGLTEEEARAIIGL